MTIDRRHVAIVGTTASGKSSLALSLCRGDPAFEIVSLDSMQVYRGMDIGTAKPTQVERAEVRHHLIDVVEAGEPWSVAETQRAARQAIAEIEARGGRALLVGGTGLYVQAVIDGFELPGEDLRIRAELVAATSEPDELARAWRELQTADPVAAARIDPRNQRRIVRALEVMQFTGRPFSSFGPGVFDGSASAAGRSATPAIDVTMLGIFVDRAAGAAAITQRVATMRDAGLVTEVERLLAQPWARTARQAIGYKEIADALERNESIDAAFDLVIRRTRKFARRQRMWFRRDPRITWLRAGEFRRVETAAAVVCARREDRTR